MELSHQPAWDKSIRERGLEFLLADWLHKEIENWLLLRFAKEDHIDRQIKKTFIPEAPHKLTRMNCVVICTKLAELGSRNWGSRK